MRISTVVKLLALASFGRPIAFGGHDLEELLREDDSICVGDACAVSLLQRNAVALQQHAMSEDTSSRNRTSIRAKDVMAKANNIKQYINSTKLTELSMIVQMAHVLRDFARGTPIVLDGLPASFVNPALMISWCFCAFYGVCIVYDVSKVVRLSRVERPKPGKSSGKDDDLNGEWSATRMLMLCFYRTYSGFLAATWLPYVLALEGEWLWPNNQSLFMGIAMLIYAIVALTSPMCGLVGDMFAEISMGAARRLWICCGIVLSTLGIIICLFSGPRRLVFSFMFGILIWRLGESLNDITTEAIVLDLIPMRQFGLANAIKASAFMVGGLLGYVALYFMAAVHYTWCYYAYLGCIFLMVIPSLLLLNNDNPGRPNMWRAGNTFSHNISHAYITPMTFRGGFPEMSFAIFIMSCGTAPLFFILLIIRDLLGVNQEVALTKVFAINSLLFFLAAAGGTVIDARWGWGGRAVQTPSGEVDGEAYQQATDFERRLQRQRTLEWDTEKMQRLCALVILSLIFGLVVLALPTVQCLATITSRFELFCPLVIIIGITFGLGYSRLHDTTWRLLPNTCDMANAMGFNLMCRNFGLGVGNFLFGVLLTLFREDHPETSSAATRSATTNSTSNPGLASYRQVYTPAGYDWMCIGCFCFNVYAGFLTWRLKRKLETTEIARPAG